eukprot:CAMPEP_0115682548 /NCGR_PEP_ID=MMETSP0272-20121206/57915_1 /TAXON_ID=71861 /ORGANISM="Scrippsiella trochoidea, Strain CCMP3099" /LENGTH=261 /DNA_ID=CAMNT_0003121935 /DNA_START=16 /DNA_END=798 /DNA_ORIENTATION=+
MAFTQHWSAGENSIVRNSFNAIVKRKQCDVPSAIWKQTTMGRQAELGPTWVPNGIKARVLAGTLPPEEESRVSCPSPLHTMPLPTVSSPLSLRPPPLDDAASERSGSSRPQTVGGATWWAGPREIHAAAQQLGAPEALIVAFQRHADSAAGTKEPHALLGDLGGGLPQAPLQQDRVAQALRRLRVHYPDGDNGPAGGARAEVGAECHQGPKDGGHLEGEAARSAACIRRTKARRLRVRQAAGQKMQVRLRDRQGEWRPAWS